MIILIYIYYGLYSQFQRVIINARSDYCASLLIDLLRFVRWANKLLSESRDYGSVDLKNLVRILLLLLLLLLLFDFISIASTASVEANTNISVFHVEIRLADHW